MCQEVVRHRRLAQVPMIAAQILVGGIVALGEEVVLLQVQHRVQVFLMGLVCVVFRVRLSTARHV